MNRRAARRWRAPLAALAAAMIAVGLGTVATTTAAWTDPAAITLQASTGQWAPTAGSGPVTAGNSATRISDLTWDLRKNPAQVCFTFTVTTTSRDVAVPWSVKLDLAAAPFAGASQGWEGGDLGLLVLDSSVPGWLSISGSKRGTPSLKQGETFTFTLCNWDLPEPSVNPDAYRVKTEPGTWNENTACTVVTVTGTGTSPFYVAWEYDLDLSAARAATGGTRVSWTNYNEVDHVLQGEGIHARSGSAGVIKGVESVTDTVCVHKY